MALKFEGDNNFLCCINVLGLRPGPGGDYYDHYIRTYSRNTALSANAGFNPEYINFVEDCMLVLLILSIIFTKML